MVVVITKYWCFNWTPTSNSNKIIIMNQTNGGNTVYRWKHMLTYTIGGTTNNARYMQMVMTQITQVLFSHVLYWFHEVLELMKWISNYACNRWFWNILLWI